MEYFPQKPKGKRDCKMGRRSAELQAARRNRGIYEVLTDELTLVWNLKKGTALALPCTEKNDSRGEPQAGRNSIDASEEQSVSENTGACWKVKRQRMGHIAEKGYVRSFLLGLVRKAVSIQEALKIPEAKPHWIKHCKWKIIPAWAVK